MSRERTYRFRRQLKDHAKTRQQGRCAYCGDPLDDLERSAQHGHHVVPDQVGRAGDPRDDWMRELENCVVLCFHCHHRIHENGKWANGHVALPRFFPYSHGRNRSLHLKWARQLTDRWDERHR